MKKERNNILENIVKFRKDRQLSQDYVATRIGMKQSGYALIESGERGLQYNVLLQIAMAMNVDVIDIIAYPGEYVEKDIASSMSDKKEPVEAILQIKLQSDKKDQVLKLVFGENNLEILNK